MIRAGGGYGFPPVQTFFSLAPNQKRTISLFCSQAKEQANFCPQYNATFLPVLWTNFLFFHNLLNKPFSSLFAQQSGALFRRSHSPPPTYHLVDPLVLVNTLVTYMCWYPGLWGWAQSVGYGRVTSWVLYEACPTHWTGGQVDQVVILMVRPIA